ncbi:MAG: DegV family protein [Actinobacteria bacterium]|nr:DegV family protein [Actinomycetota bacterium]
MNAGKIAILVDSGSDVPKDFLQKYGLYVVPLTIIYSDGEYRDGIDIQPEDVYARLSDEIPTTSMPSPSVVSETFKQIKADGYEKVVVITISSGLSGTHEVVRSFGPSPEGLEVAYIDTKNIGIGSGLSAIRAGELIEQGLSFSEICREVERAAKNTKLFFCVATLEYLAKGGRIGLVSAMLGTILNLKPVITCNEEGVYDTVAKAKGRKKSLMAALEQTVAAATGCKEYNIAVVHGDAREEADELLTMLKERLPNYRLALEGPLTPSLVVHTGPGLIGIGVQCLG